MAEKATGIISENWTVFCGSVAHSVGEIHLLALEEQVLGVCNHKIKFLENASELEQLQRLFGFSEENVQYLTKGEFIIPGFIDTHIHAPQYSNLGLGLGEELFDWLQKIKYPCEKRCENLNFAKDNYNQVVRDTLTNGTTTALYMGTSNSQATLLLCDIIEKQGQRAYVGKLSCDRNVPEWYCEKTDEAIRSANIFIENVSKRKNPLLTPVVTVGFVLSSSARLLKALAEIARKNNLPTQSHLGETADQTEKFHLDFPQKKSCTEAFDECQFLTNKTIMAHGVYLTEEEIEILKNRGVGIAHCPNSNINLKSGLCDVRRLINRGLKVGLGTDICGGYSVSILDAMRQAIQTSRIISMSKPKDYQPITHKEAFFLATRGGSQVLGLEDTLGNFEIGKNFDALVIDAKDGHMGFFQEDTLEEKIERFIYLGDDRNIKSVYVNGRQVK